MRLSLLLLLLFFTLLCNFSFCDEEKGKGSGSEHIEILLRKLEIDDYVVRSATLNRLFYSDDKRIPAAVEKVFKSTSDEDCRYWCACLLLKTGSEEAKKFLLKGLRSESERHRYHAIAAFGRAKEKSVLDELKEAFKHDPVPQVKTVAAYALANLQVEEGYQFLKEKVKDHSWLSQDMAAVLLGWLKRDDSKTLLEELFKSIPSTDVDRKGIKICAAWGLAHFGSEEAKLYLVEAGHDSLTAQVGICEVGEPMIEPLLKVLKENSSASARRNAATLLGILGNAEVIAPLAAALKDPTYSVATAAAIALGYTMHKNAVEPLASLATNPEANTILRHSAVKALAILRLDSCIEPLTKLLDGSACKKKDDKSQISLRENAASALAKIGSEDAVKPLCAVLSNKETPLALRKSLCWTVAEYRISAAVPTLVEILKEEDPEIKKYAASALRVLCGKDYGTDYEKWKSFLEDGSQKSLLPFIRK
ncbi:MAG: HEAT repeat domain-containing protein [Planctomycetota bacterium]|nr:HEAT repeat domain-containing protein [Planctomycetota bacterium]